MLNLLASSKPEKFFNWNNKLRTSKFVKLEVALNHNALYLYIIWLGQDIFVVNTRGGKWRFYNKELGNFMNKIQKKYKIKNTFSSIDDE